MAQLYIGGKNRSYIHIFIFSNSDFSASFEKNPNNIVRGARAWVS